MGYYTKFKLRFVLPEVITDFADKLREHGIDIPSDVKIIQSQRALQDSVIYAMKEEEVYGCDGFLLDVYEGTSDKTKWYDWELDMRSFSEKFPTVLFCLSGEGEDNGDMWKAYFKNGKMQLCKARVTFDPFDEDKLE